MSRSFDPAETMLDGRASRFALAAMWECDLGPVMNFLVMRPYAFHARAGRLSRLFPGRTAQNG